MFCKKCGNRITQVANFCKKCGEPIKHKNGRFKEKNRGKKNRLLILIALFIVLIMGICVMPQNGCKLPEKSKSVSEINSIIDAKEFYEQNGTVVSMIEATESHTVQSEKSIYRFLQERGFEGVEIYSDFTMTGAVDEEEYGDTDEANGINEYSEAVHPEYFTCYITENGAVWSIILINGNIFANPLFYNEQPNHQVQLVLSETDTITGYDNITNTFFDVLLKPEVMKVVVVDKIDVNTLEKMTKEELDKL